MSASLRVLWSAHRRAVCARVNDSESESGPPGEVPVRAEVTVAAAPSRRLGGGGRDPARWRRGKWIVMRRSAPRVTEPGSSPNGSLPGHPIAGALLHWRPTGLGWASPGYAARYEANKRLAVMRS